jgi:putative membrane protein
MPRMIISLIVIVLMASLTARVVQAAPEVTANTDSFLTKAAEEQLIEIALGLLVAQRARNGRVKDYAAQMAADHMKLSRQLEELAAKKGVKLPPGLNPEHKQKVDELSQLSGHAFDRTYLSYIIRHHEDNVQEFGKDAKTLQDLDAKQWVDLTLPLFQAHREKAISIKNSLQTTP